MKLKDLKEELERVDPAAVLVTSSALNRVIQQVLDLPPILWEVPHRKSFVVDRQVLFRHIEPDDLELNPERVLPDTVILLLRPSHEELHSNPDEVVRLEYWRRLFHACVHRTLDAIVHEKRLPLEKVRERIQEIGWSQFQEAKHVLSQENYLVPSAKDRTIYIEFAAVFLELYYFAPSLLETYFPSIQDRQRVKTILGREFDTDQVFEDTRIDGAKDPEIQDQRTDNVEANDFYYRLTRTAERAEEVGNLVRGAILRTRAARIAPAELTVKARENANDNLRRLMQRLCDALELDPASIEEWMPDLRSLLEKADQDSRPVEARMLYDLQNACIDHEREIYAIGVVDWLVSLGRKPIKRPLPSQRHVRIIQHLRSAAQRLTTARLTDDARQHLGGLLEEALKGYEDRLRRRFRPVLEAALKDVGLVPENIPEQTACLKIIEEILDRITDQGFLSFSDLRDTLSRNQLKLNDLADPRDFSRGDALLRLDRRLATLLDGVYRPGEMYMTILERITAVNFGTKVGRVLTKFVTIPFGGAYLAVEGVGLIFHTIDQPYLSMMSELISVGAVGIFFLALMHWREFRTCATYVAEHLWYGIRLLFFDVPIRVARTPWIHEVFASWPIQVLYWVFFKPIAFTLLLWLLFPQYRHNYYLWGGLFVGLTFAINSTAGRAISEVLWQSTVQFWDLLRSGLIRGLFDLCLYVFKRIVDFIEGTLFQIDEWLRFRRGEGQFSLAIRTILGVLWFPIAYLARFYVVVLIEPGFNPIKAPVSYLAAKFMAPFFLPLTAAVAGFMEPVLGKYVSYAIAVSTVWLSPDVFGFLFWEMKENWCLYEANRPKTLKPERIGPHGETMRSLLHPGFHTGTVPNLFAKLRKAEREGTRTGDWRRARTHRRTMEHIEKSVALFVERNLLTLLEHNRHWENVNLQMGTIRSTCATISIQLLHPNHPDEPFTFAMREQDGWLLARIEQHGWLKHLKPQQLWTLNSGLASLYKQADVGLVHEQINAALTGAYDPPPFTYDISADYLTVWQDRRNGNSLRYALNNPDELLTPEPDDESEVKPTWVLESSKLIFERVPLYWNQWVDCWDTDHEGTAHFQLLSAGTDIILSGQTLIMRSAKEDASTSEEEPDSNMKDDECA